MRHTGYVLTGLVFLVLGLWFFYGFCAIFAIWHYDDPVSVWSRQYWYVTFAPWLALALCGIGIVLHKWGRDFWGWWRG